ncbi:hypothetical protein Glove_151g173 [Diversispora epigaea]|uniref:Uncharacterized protein n=1 Tax=Diversispora epigaea TaxID=1348612 RepID=A0A397J1H0_9GLOM|nr:hypothetical protein Glove_151g173 [Diversispora epigaea]
MVHDEVYGFSVTRPHLNRIDEYYNDENFTHYSRVVVVVDFEMEVRQQRCHRVMEIIILQEMSDDDDNNNNNNRSKNGIFG